MPPRWPLRSSSYPLDFPRAQKSAFSGSSAAWRRAQARTSVPERSRKLPNAQPAFELKRWHFVAILVVFTGVGGKTAWDMYEKLLIGDSFEAYKLVAKKPVSSTASIFVLEPQIRSKKFEDYRAAWKKGIWNVHFKQPQIQIVRAYTPLPPAEGESDNDGVLRFLIRRDPHGEMSSYLHSLPLGSKIELRGPNLEYQLSPEVKQVVFFAGGTGIAPALQVAYTMFDAESGKADTAAKAKERKLHILWASRKREDCIGGYSDAPTAETLPPKPTWSGFFTKQKAKPAAPITEEHGVVVRELENLKKIYPGRVTVEYFVNEEDTWLDQDAVFRALSRFDDKDFSTGTTTPQEQRQILISGPSGFISYLAGPKEWRNGGERQGSVSKIIAHAISLNPHNVKIWKI